MNPESIEEARSIATGLNKKAKKFKGTKVIVCPPYLYLNELKDIFASQKKISLGAQDIFIGEGMSHTGEISSEMLKNTGVKYIIVGHSEKRELGDTEGIVREKLLGALRSGFKVILCVGEKERSESGQQYRVVQAQIESALMKLPKSFAKKIIIAYEPVWAIGKSESQAMKPEALHEMVIFIKKIMTDMLGAKNIKTLSILYGGSVTKGNAKEIVSSGSVEGLLVGRESLNVENFSELIAEL
jgi:triosephosphate isomerase